VDLAVVAASSTATANRLLQNPRRAVHPARSVECRTSAYDSRVSAEVVTTWGVVLDLDEDAADPTLDAMSLRRQAACWFEAARRAYFDRCPRLATLLREQVAGLAVSAEQIGPLPSGPYRGGVMVAVSVAEVRTSSFDMALRIRLTADHDAPPASGRCTVALVRDADGAVVRIPREIRDEFIALELGASAWL